MDRAGDGRGAHAARRSAHDIHGTTHIRAPPFARPAGAPADAAAETLTDTPTEASAEAPRPAGRSPTACWPCSRSSCSWPPRGAVVVGMQARSSASEARDHKAAMQRQRRVAATQQDDAEAHHGHDQCRGCEGADRVRRPGDLARRGRRRAAQRRRRAQPRRRVSTTRATSGQPSRCTPATAPRRLLHSMPRPRRRRPHWPAPSLRRTISRRLFMADVRWTRWLIAALRCRAAGARGRGRGGRDRSESTKSTAERQSPRRRAAPPPASRDHEGARPGSSPAAPRSAAWSSPWRLRWPPRTAIGDLIQRQAADRARSAGRRA